MPSVLFPSRYIVRKEENAEGSPFLSPSKHSPCKKFRYIEKPTGKDGT